MLPPPVFAMPPGHGYPRVETDVGVVAEGVCLPAVLESWVGKVSTGVAGPDTALDPPVMAPTALLECVLQVGAMTCEPGVVAAPPAAASALAMLGRTTVVLRFEAFGPA